MAPLRRDQIIKATILSIVEIGVHKTSIKQVAQRAGNTTGLIFHYFDTREGLFGEVYLYIYAMMEEEMRHRLADAVTPTEKIKAICEAQVSDRLLHQDIVSCWAALFSMIPEHTFLGRLERIYYRRIRSNLAYELQQFGLEVADSRVISNELSTLIDGFWLRKATDPSIENETIQAALDQYLMRTLKI